ncbi:caspase recruitment domain-containing protein 9 [Suricata suricatta]|uniref:caspase recruitment domain-containing protein 9 n=1 Tax=Suricata suricatta TaxID=37032 RepID=UPI001155EE9F|nr:caspase recruitment domain-containing protein 9 [Suricata suricatta]
MEGNSGGWSQHGWPPCQAWPRAGLGLLEREAPAGAGTGKPAERARVALRPAVGAAAGPSPVGGPHAPLPSLLLHHQPATGKRGGGGARPERTPRLGRRKSRTARPGLGASLPTPAREALPAGGGHRGQSRTRGIVGHQKPPERPHASPTVVSTPQRESKPRSRAGLESSARGELASQAPPPGSRPERSQGPAMSDYENEDECWSALEGFRVRLVSAIDPSRITPYLRQCKVLNPDDEEQVLSDPNLVIRKRKVGVLLDILQRTGHKGYVAFLESLELYYPQLYKKVTGKEPTRVFSMIIDASGESGLTQLLMSEVLKLQRKVQDLTQLLSSKDDLIKELRVKDSLLRKHQERVQRLKEELEAGGRELKRCKDENYELAVRLARRSEEKGAALMRTRDLQLEVPAPAAGGGGVRALGPRAGEKEGKPDESSPYIQVLEEDWRQALRENQEKASTILSLRKDLRQSEALHTRVRRRGSAGRPGGLPLAHTAPRCRRPLSAQPPYLPPSLGQRHRGLAASPHPQAHNPRPVWKLRAGRGQAGWRAVGASGWLPQCAEEKEVFELQCLALRKDCKMYKDRIEAILQQMEEVAVERDQAIATREELHAQHARSLQEKDALRKQVRELAEKADELQLQLFQSEGQLLALEGRLRRQQLETLVLSSDLEDSSPRNSQDLSLPPDLEAAQLSDKGGPAHRDGPQQPFEALQEESLPLTPNNAGLGGGEPPEKERRRLKESFENYRRKRALRKLQHASRQGEADWENTTGSDNTDTEGS